MLSPIQSPRTGFAAAPRRELRCPCGCLLARADGAQIELKCRRCKRVVSVTPGAPGDGDVRCPCGSLLARRADAGLQLKCRRCKREGTVTGQSDDDVFDIDFQHRCD